jgi:hypothetical protein
MFRNAGETGAHLLVHCPLASDLWNSVLCSFGVLWVFPDNITDLLFGWHNYFGNTTPRFGIWCLYA